jgi:transposase
MIGISNEARSVVVGSNKSNLKTIPLSKLQKSKNSTRQSNLSSASEIITSSESSDSEKSLCVNNKIEDHHLEHLRKYLTEDSYIGHTEAAIRLHKDADSKVGIIAVRNAIVKLRKEMGLELSSLDQSTLKNRLLKDYSKFKNSHLEYLRKYLEEGKFIESIEAKNRLLEETGIEIQISVVHKAMINLRKEMGLDYLNLSQPTLQNRLVSGRYKLKDSDLEYLKKYLIEDRFIGHEEAKNRLQADTGLKIDPSTARSAMKTLRREMGLETPYLDQSILKNDSLGDRSKIKDSHLEYIKKYLKEDNLIGPTEVKNKLFQETNLEVSIQTVGKAMKNMRAEMGIDMASIRLSEANSRRSTTRTKLKDSHLECLKKYLEEDRYIGPAEARDRLQEETDLEISIPLAQKTMLKLRKEMGPEYSDLDPAIVKNRKSSDISKLEDSHLECLKSYLKEDNSIGPTEVRNRLQEETGLKINVAAMKNVMTKLREEMGPEYAILDSSTTKSKKSNDLAKLKDLHLDHLKGYLNEDIDIGPTEAKNRLQKDTGLTISVTTVSRTLKTLRE